MHTQAEFKAKLAAKATNKSTHSAKSAKKPAANKTFATVGETLVQLKNARDVVQLALQVCSSGAP